MQHVTPEVLLQTWEIGMADPRRGARSHALLTAACSERTAHECTELTVGECDASLLALREQVFGSLFAGWVACPNCSQGLELEFHAADVRSTVHDTNRKPLGYTGSDYSVRFRAPRAEDLARIEPGESAQQQHKQLLALVVIEASHRGEPCLATDLPEAVVEAIESALEQSDSEVLTHLDVSCDACKHQWSAPFDIASYLWTELERWAVRLLWEVHALARAYAWKESDLIQMSPWRRQRYLEMLET